ncbi:hydroxyacylglutathione hydrolase [Stappia sp.]|jgi:hydroxyacylglutathione hydrolase|uniref:hydroxyacylglutathione hydrolase n=1 Tax=Stappia sp. TaxID=1870903 RepID=UPI003A991138
MNGGGMDADIRQFACLDDNFGVILHLPATERTIAIDVPDAAPYLAVLAETGWRLTDILITHHHWDHVQGLEALKAETGARATGPEMSRDRIVGLDAGVSDGERLEIGGLLLEAIGTPGHTLDQISWFAPQIGFAHTGDTLFSLGCGRVFEGDMAMMWSSLDKLADRLPGDTRIYCGHEYTLSNARFALTIDPQNTALVARAEEVEALRSAGRPALPTTMSQELATNPFLRARDPAIRAGLGMETASDAEVFAEIRRRKDSF